MELTKHKPSRQTENQLGTNDSLHCSLTSLFLINNTAFNLTLLLQRFPRADCFHFSLRVGRLRDDIIEVCKIKRSLDKGEWSQLEESKLEGINLR